MATATKPIPLESQQQWMKPRQWRELTGMPHGTTHTLIREGKIRAVKIGGRVYIPTTELQEFFLREGTPAA